jgi:hypothetical protein
MFIAETHESVTRSERCCPTMRIPRVRFTLWRMMVWVALAALVFSYLGSYYRLSRRGMREVTRYGADEFLYAPYHGEPVLKEEIECHYARMKWYAPLNWLDRTLLNGPVPRNCFIRVSG